VTREGLVASLAQPGGNLTGISVMANEWREGFFYSIKKMKGLRSTAGAQSSCVTPEIDI